MGEFADMIIEGFVDSETGEVIDGDAPGYPRTSRKKHSGNNMGPRCPNCGKKLKNTQGLNDHLRDVHGGRGNSLDTTTQDGINDDKKTRR